MTPEKPHLYECQGCPYYGPRVGCKGDVNSPIVIIGESPGKKELEQLLPFVGPSGALLDSQVRKYGVEPYYINALQCFPGYSADKNEDKMKQACANCRHHVLDEIAKAPRKVILALGAPALWSVTNNYDLKITQERGKFITTPLAEIGCIASVHPAFLMRGGSGATFQQYCRDIEYAFGLATGHLKRKRPPEVHYFVAERPEDVFDFAATIHDVELVGADVETSGFSPVDDYMLCAGFAWHPNQVFVVPEHLLPYSSAIFAAPTKFGWHNGKFDVRFFWKMGIQNARVDDDSMLLSYALDENGGIHDLEQVASDWLNSPNWKKMLEQYLPKARASYTHVPRPILHEYMAYDVGNTQALITMLRKKVMSDRHLSKLYTGLLIPASNFLAQVEMNGLYVDTARVEENDGIYQARLKEYGDDLREFAKPFPESGYTDKLVNSHQQLTRLLYDDLKIKPHKNKRTTDKKVLEHLPPHPFLTALGKYRKVAKERGTYILPVKEKRASDLRVHTSYKLHGTRTGRLASSDPNVQNVPRNPVIRGQYIAAPGRRYIEVDLNQAELRLLALLSKCPVLGKIYLTKGMSLHDEVRAENYGYPKDWSEKDVQRFLKKFSLRAEERFDEHGKDLIVAEQKMRAKNVNFGIIYGITAVGLAEQTDDTPSDAQIMLNNWRKQFPVASQFLEKCRQAPINGQVLITNFGRKKRVGVVSNELLNGIQNEAANFAMQSPASDCTLEAGILLEDELRDTYNATVNNLIHDALLIECPDDDEIAQKVARRTIDVMESVPIKRGLIGIPFIAEAKSGYRWGSLKEMHVQP